MKIKQYLDEFAVLRMADLYRHLFGPKGDRLCRFHPDPAGYRLTWRQGDDILSLDCHLVNQRLMVRTSIMPDAIEIPLTSYRQGIYGGVARYAFACPECSRRVFHLYAPSPGRLIRPDGTMNRPEPLCHQCHGLSYPLLAVWRYQPGTSHAAETETVPEAGTESDGTTAGGLGYPAHATLLQVAQGRGKDIGARSP